MNIEDRQALEQWADSHKTSIEIAEAIFFVADGDDDAERVWQEPTKEEILAIWEHATNNGLVDGSDLWWGVDNLATILKQETV